MLFCNSEGLPITEHLPEGHEGREIYGIVKDEHPDKGRALGRLEEQRGHELHKRDKSRADSSADEAGAPPDESE